MVLIKRSVEAPRSPSIAARSLLGPTSGGPLQACRPRRGLKQQCPVSEDTQQGLEKVHRMKKSSVVVEAVKNEVIDLERMERGDTQIS
jgi:hypothetical protein